MGNTTSAPPFFTRAPDPTHVHPMRASDVAQIEADLCTRLPVELTHAVLEYAGVWAACRRECRKPLTARARVIPRGRRGLPPDGEWGTGQEGEARELGLEDDRGNLWCLLSAPVGCIGVGGGGGVEEGEREGENVWVRKIVVETTSKDQGWADDMENYGTCAAIGLRAACLSGACL
jgi:hypothetical protein